MLKRMLRRLGLQPIPKSPEGWGRMAVRSRFDDLQRLVSNVKIVVDAGAAHGHMTQLFLDLFPEATIHAIEPNPNSVKVLQNKFSENPRVIIHPVALGNQNGVVSFNVLGRHTSSSVLQPSPINVLYHPNEMGIDQKIQVPLSCLDDIISSTIDVIKLDLQGYELEALKGAMRSLKNVRAITTEIAFVTLYDNQPLFGDIDVFLRQQSFRLVNLYELWTQQDGQLTAGDAIYIKTM